MFARAPQQREPGTHHQRVGLANEIRLHPGRQLDRRHQRAACRDDAVLRRSGEVGVGADQLRAFAHQTHGALDRLVGVHRGLADHHVVGVDVVSGVAGLIERVDQAGLADHIRAAPRRLRGQKRGGGHGAGVKMALVDVYTHAVELFAQFTRRPFAAVREKEKGDARRA